VPGAEGDFGVLPGHTPFLTTLRPGLIDIHDGGSISQSLFVEGGFAEATETRCTVLAIGVRPMSDVTPEDAATRLAAANDALSTADDDNRAAAEAERGAAEAMVKATEMRTGAGG
jgi:F-type H+-transporting ATPase subunit epsilon